MNSTICSSTRSLRHVNVDHLLHSFHELRPGQAEICFTASCSVTLRQCVVDNLCVVLFVYTDFRALRVRPKCQLARRRSTKVSGQQKNTQKGNVYLPNTRSAWPRTDERSRFPWLFGRTGSLQQFAIRCFFCRISRGVSRITSATSVCLEALALAMRQSSWNIHPAAFLTHVSRTLPCWSTSQLQHGDVDDVVQR